MEAIRATGGEALPVAAHTGNPQAVQALVAETEKAYGGMDILVNNAAANPHFGPLLSAEESHWEKTLDVNLRGYFRLIKACVPSMRQRGGGKIINVASVGGIQAQPGLGVYCVSKAGVIMLTQVLALELAADNIQVNATASVLAQTRFSQVLWQTPALYQQIIQHIPQGRFAQPGELAGIALYLASPASSFTTGAVFVVNGDQLAGSSISPGA